jgi:hypothetical protein
MTTMTTESRDVQARRQFDAFSHFPPAVHAAALRLLEAITQIVPQAPAPPPEGTPPRYPRRALELAVLDALAPLHPMGASPRDLAQVLPYSHQEISRMLQGLVLVGTVHRLGHGYFVLGPEIPTEERLRKLGVQTTRPYAHGQARLPVQDLPPSTRYAAQIASIVAQETSRETTTSATPGGARRKRAAP